MNTTTVPTKNIEDHQWMPVRRLRQYAVARAIGGVLFGSIFVGWMIIMWHVPTMRYAAMTMLGVTAVVTFVSIRNDVKAAAGRQVTLIGDTLEIVSPEETKQIRLADVTKAVWRDDCEDSTGLWLLDEQGKTLVHLGMNYVGQEAEARVFMGWLRRQTHVSFDVDWKGAAS